MTSRETDHRPTVLITGGAGFIGSHLAEHYASRAHVRVLDSLRSGSRENLAGLDVEWMEGSILDRRLVRKAVRGADLVFHLAAMTSVPESMEDPIGCEAINVRGLLTVLEEAAKASVRRLCLASSAAVYGDDPVVPKIETMAPQPRSPYAITKLAGEYYCDLFRREGWVDAVSLRFFNVYGPRQNPASHYAAAVPIFIEKALKGEDLTVFGDGGQTRDFVFVKDVVRAAAFVAAHPELHGVYNVGRGERTTVGELAETIVAETGSASRLVHAPVRAGDVRHSRAGVDRLRSAGFEAEWSLARGLSQTIAWYRARHSNGFLMENPAGGA